MASRELEQADELLRKARYGEAIERFRTLLSAEPENPELRARCGEAYRLSGNRDRAFHHYNKGASIYARGGDATNALRLLQYANAVAPNEPDILFRMAECLRALGEHASLEPLLRQIVAVARGSGDRRRVWALDVLAELHPDDLEVAVRRAEALGEVGRINEAVQAWRTLGPRLDQRGVDFVPMVQRAASAAPDRPDVAVELAGVLVAQRRPREALALLVPFYEKFPDDVGILELLLRALEALGAADKIVPARIELIKARAKRGLREAAAREIAILLESAPEDPHALEVSAHAYAAFGEEAAALALWRRLMHLCERTGRRFERDRAVLQVLKVDQDDEEALVLGGRALREAGRDEEALVLETRLAALRKRKARGPVPAKSTPVGPPRGASAAAPPHTPAPTSSPSKRSFEESVVPDEMPGESAFAMFGEEEDDDELDLSEPSLEAMPIARNPFDEGLDLGVVGAREPSGLYAALATPPEYTGDPTSPANPVYQPPPTRPPAPPTRRPPGSPEAAWSATPAARGGSAQAAADEAEEPGDETKLMDPRTAEHEAGTALGTLGLDTSGGSFDVDLALAVENPTSTEETTSRSAVALLAELDELRGSSAGRTARRGAEGSGARAAGRSPAPKDFEAEARPTLRARPGETFGEAAPAGPARPKKA